MTSSQVRCYASSFVYNLDKLVHFHDAGGSLVDLFVVLLIVKDTFDEHSIKM